MKVPITRDNMYVIPDSFEPLYLSELESLDIGLVYGSNDLTQKHARERKKEYGTASIQPTHAFLFIQKNFLIIDPLFQTDFGSIKKYLSQKDTRIDVIRIQASEKNKQDMIDIAHEVGIKERVYDLGGYGNFGSEMKGWLWKLLGKVTSPSEKRFFCSDFCAYIYQQKNIRVSYRDHNNTAPIDLLIFACDRYNETFNSNGYKLFTLKKKGEML